MNKKELIEKLIEMEQDAMNEYFDTADIAVKDYVNPEIMGLLDYQNYVDLYFQFYGVCFECETSPCDEGCPYQVDKGDKNEQ